MIMIKELIKKYKVEFNHWLDGGTLLHRHFDHKKQEFDIWEVCDEGFLWNVKPIKHPCIIINDEYVEFRKALAEGKTIQYNPIHARTHNRWDDIKSINPGKDDTISCYRIKPEEPQFKAGDFVRINSPSGQQFISIISYINKDNTVTLNKESVAYISDCIKWKPKHGELVWVTDYKSKNIARLGRYDAYTSTRELATGGYRLQEYEQVVFEYCEPFLNSKPSWFKD